MNSSTASPTITTTTPSATTATTTTAINADAKTEPESVTATPAVNQQQPIKEQQETNNNNDQQVQISADYLAQLIKDKKQLAAFPSVFIHVQRLIDDEINKVRQSLFQLSDVVHQLEPLELPEPEGEFVQLQEKLYVPVDEHPEYNFVGRLLGPRGMTAKQLEQETGCKIMIRGRGSMRDKKKEEQNRGKANWEHLNDELHVLITVEDTQNRAQLKLDRALEEVKHLLVPIVDGEDELKKRQLMELAIINGTYQRHYNGQNYPANSANINGSSVSSGIPSTGSNTPNSVHGPPAGLKSHQRTHNSNKQQQQQQQASQHSHQAHKQQQVNAAHLHQHSPSPHHPQPAGPLPQQHHQHPGHQQQQQLANHLPPHLHHHPHHPHPHQSTAVAAAAAAAAAALMANPADPSALLYAQQYHDFHHYAALAAAAAAAQQQQHLLGPPPDYHAQQQASQQQPPSAVAAAVAQAVAQANQQIQQHHHHHHHQQQQHYQHQIESEQQHQAALAACYNQQAHQQQQQQQHLIVNQPDSLAGETQMNGNDNTREHPDPELAHEEPMAKASGLAGNNRLAQHHQEQQIANSSDTASANMCG